MSLGQGWAIIFAWGHFEKATFSRRLYLLMEVEASPAL